MKAKAICAITITVAAEMEVDANTGITCKMTQPSVKGSSIVTTVEGDLNPADETALRELLQWAAVQDAARLVPKPSSLEVSIKDGRTNQAVEPISGFDTGNKN